MANYLMLLFLTTACIQIEIGPHLVYHETLTSRPFLRLQYIRSQISSQQRRLQIYHRIQRRPPHLQQSNKCRLPRMKLQKLFSPRLIAMRL
jgi:hypothetical protein